MDAVWARRCHQCHAAIYQCLMLHAAMLCAGKRPAVKDSSLHTRVRAYLKVEGKKEALYEHSHAEGCLQHQQPVL